MKLQFQCFMAVAIGISVVTGLFILHATQRQTIEITNAAFTKMLALQVHAKNMMQIQTDALQKNFLDNKRSVIQHKLLQEATRRANHAEEQIVGLQAQLALGERHTTMPSPPPPVVVRDYFHTAVSLPGRLGDNIAYTQIFNTNAPDRFQMQRQTWLHKSTTWFGFGAKGDRGMLRGVDFIMALYELYQEADTAVKWFVLSDDDTYMFVDNLALLLLSFNSSAPVYMGTHHCQGPMFTCANGRPVYETLLRGWVCGGPGIVLSRALMSLIDWDTAVTHYKDINAWPHVAADVALACAVQDAWPEARIEHHPGFFREDMHVSECECAAQNKCTFSQEVLARNDLHTGQLPISVHHITAKRMQNLHLDRRVSNAASVYNFTRVRLVSTSKRRRQKSSFVQVHRLLWQTLPMDTRPNHNFERLNTAWVQCKRYNCLLLAIETLASCVLLSRPSVACKWSIPSNDDV